MDNDNLTIRGSVFAMLHECIYRQLTVNLYIFITEAWGDEANRSKVLTDIHRTTLISVPTHLVQKYMTDSLLLFKDAC
jgi:hypothetical protein